MKVKELITRLLDEPMEAEVCLQDPTEHKSNGAMSKGGQAIEILADEEKLPSAEPERKTGWWIPQYNNKTSWTTSTGVHYYSKCSVCGCWADYTNFCPNCGAYMIGEPDGQILNG